MQGAVFTADELATLLAEREPSCVSILLPVDKADPRGRQARIRLKTLLRQAASELAAGVDRQGPEELLREAIGLVEDEPFWAHPRRGLALYVAAGFQRAYWLPVAVREQVVVGRSFLIRPLLPLLRRGERFHVLALSANEVRLLEATADDFRRLELPEAPRDLDEAMGHPEYYSGLGLHTASPAALGRGAAIFHGHGDGDEENLKDDLVHYFRRLVDALEKVIPDGPSPLVLAAVAHYQPLFARANRRFTLLDEMIEGNPELLSDADLQARAWELVEPWLAARAAAAERRLGNLRASGRAAAALGEVLEAAAAGRVDTLLVAAEAEEWGSFDPATGELSRHPERQAADVDLLDLAAARTLAARGTVHVVEGEELPEGGPVAALLRY